MPNPQPPITPPQLQGHFWYKCKLLRGGKKAKGEFSRVSSRQPVQTNTVTWSETVQFEVRTTTDETGELSPLYLRFSVRKESKGGKETKLGIVDINLAGDPRAVWEWVRVSRQ